MKMIWTDEEIALLRELWPKGGDIASKALPHRTREALATKAKDLRIFVERYLWTKAEDAVLYAMYEHASAEEIMKALPGRTMTACSKRAYRLKLARRADNVQSHKTEKPAKAKNARIEPTPPVVQDDDDPFYAPVCKTTVSNWRLDHPIGAKSVFTWADRVVEAA